MVALATRWPDDLAARAEHAAALLRSCRLCSRGCGADRTLAQPPHGAPAAWCRLGEDAYAYKELLSHGEEACLSPTWLIDLSGCSLRCLFCTEWTAITRPAAAPAVPLRSGWFLRRLAHHAAAGARTISFVGGEPTVNLPAVLRVLADVPADLRLPIIWNSNGLISAAAHALLAGVVHSWVIDLKVASDESARRLLGAGTLDYASAVRDTLDAVHPPSAPTPGASHEREPGALEPPPALVIRHLLMPARLHTDTLPLLAEIAARWPHAVVNLMTMYLPFGPALRDPKTPTSLRGLISPSDRTLAIETARQLRLHLLVDGKPPER